MIHPLEGRQHFGRVYVKARLRDACTGARKEIHTQDTVARLKGAELALFLAPQAIRPDVETACDALCDLIDMSR